MQYVMVPVPSDHVLDLLRWLQFQTEPEQPAEDAAALQRAVEAADEVTTALLLSIAEASIAGDPIRLSDAADAVDLEISAVRAALRRVDDEVLGPGRTLVKVLQETVISERGNPGRIFCLTMRVHHARVVRATVRRLERARRSHRRGSVGRPDA
jgi:hypothetical protein